MNLRSRNNKHMKIFVHYDHALNTAPSGPPANRAGVMAVGTRRIFKPFGVTIVPVESYAEVFRLTPSWAAEVNYHDKCREQ
jgi:hypothetical protein